MSDDTFTFVFPGGEVPLEFQDAVDWDRDDIEVISQEEHEERLR